MIDDGSVDGGVVDLFNGIGTVDFADPVATGGAVGGGDGRLAPAYGPRDARARRSGFAFELGPVTTAITVTAGVRQMWRIAAPPPPVFAPPRQPLTHFLWPEPARVRIRASVARMDLEPADDPDELFALGLA